MTNIECIFAAITAISVWYTLVKAARKETSWYWNLAPMSTGFCSCLWIARIFG